MDWNSSFTLDNVIQNSSSCRELWIGVDQMMGSFISSRRSDFERLGSALEDNSFVTNVELELHDGLALDANNEEFFNGLRQNTSIRALCLWGNHSITHGVYQDV